MLTDVSQVATPEEKNDGACAGERMCDFRAHFHVIDHSVLTFRGTGTVWVYFAQVGGGEHHDDGEMHDEGEMHDGDDSHCDGDSHGEGMHDSEPGFHPCDLSNSGRRMLAAGPQGSGNSRPRCGASAARVGFRGRRCGADER